MKKLRPLSALAPLTFALGLAAPAFGQDLEPRAYSPAPVGMNIILVGYGNSQGGVVFDPSVPITDVSARINGVTPGILRTFGLFGRQASVGLALPYVWGDISGNVGEERQAITRSGLGDLRARFVVNILGGPALTPKEFFARARTPALGMSLVVVVPTGQYSPTKLINIGTNRWAFKPEVGLSFPVGHWDFEAYAGAWLFMANDAFYTGSVRRTQAPLYAAQAHVGYTFLPGLWLAADGTYYMGGRSSLDGALKDDRQSNARIGLTASAPLSRQVSVKLSVAKGAAVRVGQDFTTLGAGLQYRFAGWP